MKRNGKKLLAGVGLALVGGMTLAGCGMTEEQQAALDKVVDKADEIIELVDSNMSMQNAKLSKEEAAEKIMLARNYWLSKNLQMKVYFDDVNYSGLYDKVASSRRVTVHYLKDEGVLRFVNIGRDQDEYDACYEKYDYKNDVYYSYSEHGNTDNKSFSSRTYSNTDSIDAIVGGDVLASYGFDVITPDMIMDLDVIENCYNFTVYNYTKGKDSATRNKLVLTIENDKITDFKVESIHLEVVANFNRLEKDEEGNFVESADKVFFFMLKSFELDRISVSTVEGYCQYENIDLTDINAKYAEIEKEYLTNE